MKITSHQWAHRQKTVSNAGSPWRIAGVAGVSTAVLHTIAFPPFDLAEAAWVFAVPLAAWAAMRPAWPRFIAVAYAASFASWLVLLEWLHHVTWAGMFALAAVLALFPAAWFVAVRFQLPSLAERGRTARLLVLLGLAGLWVGLEWVRSWFLTGFPWFPLAASQWERPLLLQSSSIGGAWTVSFALIFGNLGLTAQTGQHLEPMFRAGLVQPNVVPSIKWDAEAVPGIFRLIEEQTLRVAQKNADAVFWPEAVTPVPLTDNASRAWALDLAVAAGSPIVGGAIGVEGGQGPVEARAAGERQWFNGVFVIDPVNGVAPAPYRKRRRVPFGEYVPLRRWLPFVEKFVPIGEDFTRGEIPSPLLLHIGDRQWKIGAFICYEEVFPSLARASVKAGADILFVATNNAWFGERGAAWQHAAHFPRYVRWRRVGHSSEPATPVGVVG